MKQISQTKIKFTWQQPPNTKVHQNMLSGFKKETRGWTAMLSHLSILLAIQMQINSINLPKHKAV
jgi:hypothetical protein